MKLPADSEIVSPIILCLASVQCISRKLSSEFNIQLGIFAKASLLQMTGGSEGGKRLLLIQTLAKRVMFTHVKEVHTH